MLSNVESMFVKEQVLIKGDTQAGTEENFVRFLWNYPVKIPVFIFK